MAERGLVGQDRLYPGRNDFRNSYKFSITNWRTLLRHLPFPKVVDRQLKDLLTAYACWLAFPIYPSPVHRQLEGLLTAYACWLAVSHSLIRSMKCSSVFPCPRQHWFSSNFGFQPFYVFEQAKCNIECQPVCPAIGRRQTPRPASASAPPPPHPQTSQDLVLLAEQMVACAPRFINGIK